MATEELTKTKSGQQGQQEWCKIDFPNEDLFHEDSDQDTISDTEDESDEKSREGRKYKEGNEYLERSKSQNSVSVYQGVARAKNGKWVAQKGTQKKESGAWACLMKYYDTEFDAAQARYDYMANDSVSTLPRDNELKTSTVNESGQPHRC